MNDWYVTFVVYTVFCISLGFLGGYVPMLIVLLKERKKSLKHSFLVRCRSAKRNDGTWGFFVDSVFNEPLGPKVKEKIIRRGRR